MIRRMLHPSFFLHKTIDIGIPCMLYSGYRLTKEVPNLQIGTCERCQNKDVLSLYKVS